jgi:hypothetical protein
MTTTPFGRNSFFRYDAPLSGAGAAEPLPDRVRRRLLLLVAAGAMLWSVFAWWVVPSLVRAAYDGRGLSFMVKAMAHRGAYPVEHYLAKWHALAVGGMVAWVGAAALLALTTSGWFARTAVRTATPGTIGAMRVLVCAILAWFVSDFRLAEMAALPASQRVSMGVMNWLYALGWGHVVQSVPAVQTLKWICFALCVLGMAGYRTRVTLPVLAALYLALAGITRSYFWFNHSGMVPWYCLVAMCFARSGDGWSLDRLIRQRRGLSVPDADVATAHYGWARLAVWLCVCIPYMCAGMSKLRFGGLTWWDANNMQSILFADGLRPYGEMNSMKLVILPGWFFALMGLGTIVTEIGMILIPFLRPARLVLPIAMAGMHVGIFSTMGIDFHDLIALQVIFYDWSGARRWLAAKIAARRGTADAPAPRTAEVRVRRPAVPPTPSRFRAWLAPVRSRAGALGIAAMCWVMFGFWGIREEYYPFTAMQMFSNYATNSVVSYYRAYVTYEDGTTEVARLERMGNGIARYRGMLEAPFLKTVPEATRAKGREACAGLLRRSAEWWNANAATPGKRVVRMEAHHRNWDFVTQRDDTVNWGTTVDKVTVDIAPPPQSTAATDGNPADGR